MPRAACFIPGTMTTQCAFSSRSCGMPLSGVAMMSVKTSVASFRRSCGESAALAIKAEEQIDSTNAILRIVTSILRVAILLPFVREDLHLPALHHVGKRTYRVGKRTYRGDAESRRNARSSKPRTTFVVEWAGKPSARGHERSMLKEATLGKLWSCFSLVPLCPSRSLTSVAALEYLVASWACKGPSSTPPERL